MNLAQLTFSMPPEPEAWKQSIAIGVFVVGGLVAVAKMVLDCARPTHNAATTSLGLAIATLAVSVIVLASLRLNAPTDSASARLGANAVIVVGVLWITGL